MHDNHKHHDHIHGSERGHERNIEDLSKLLAMIEHWIDHGDSHMENYREWAGKAGAAGEDQVAAEIHLAISDSEAVKNHLKRAKSILAAKLILKK